MKRLHTFVYSYLPLITLIAVWWTAAFFPHLTNPIIYQKKLIYTEEPSLDIGKIKLTPLKRDTLTQALAGDFTLMTQLMADWDIEAQILQAEGIEGIQRLSVEEFILGQKIGRSLVKTNHTASVSYYPQTYLAASFLLALLSPHQITAIPTGLRKQTKLYPKELTDQILFDVDACSSEKLFLAKPEIAFIAPYSHPASVEKLRQQGIKLCLQGHLDSFSSLKEILKTIGIEVNQSAKAELLSLFMSASMMAIENRLTLVKQKLPSRPSLNPLYLNYQLHFSAPTKKMILGELIERLGLNKEIFVNLNNTDNDYRWKIPIESEQIMHLQPDCLIISSTLKEEVIKKKLLTDKVFSSLPAVKKGHIYLVDEEIQETPSQYIILAYYDLYIAFTHSLLI